MPLQTFFAPPRCSSSPRLWEIRCSRLSFAVRADQAVATSTEGATTLGRDHSRRRSGGVITADALCRQERRRRQGRYALPADLSSRSPRSAHANSAEATLDPQETLRCAGLHVGNTCTTAYGFDPPDPSTSSFDVTYTHVFRDNLLAGRRPRCSPFAGRGAPRSRHPPTSSRRPPGVGGPAT